MGVSLKEINERIQRKHPEVTLHRSDPHDGLYFYYIYDDGGSVYENESVMIPHLCNQSNTEWVDAGIEFAEKVKAQPRADIDLTKPLRLSA